MRRGDVVKMKESAVRRSPSAAAAVWAMRVGVIIEVIEDNEPAGDQCIVYWSDNTKSVHWATDLEMK